jgi:NTP pyrophosphatase (non-canonical NTP hydrolase)
MNEHSFEEIKKILYEFIKERDWVQYTSLKNSAMNISVEAAELLEHFRWATTENSLETFKKNRTDITDEIADILISTLMFCSIANINVEKSICDKFDEIKKKYPAGLVKGKNYKYKAYTKKEDDKTT